MWGRSSRRSVRLISRSCCPLFGPNQLTHPPPPQRHPLIACIRVQHARSNHSTLCTRAFHFSSTSQAIELSTTHDLQYFECHGYFTNRGCKAIRRTKARGTQCRRKLLRASAIVTPDSMYIFYSSYPSATTHCHAPAKLDARYNPYHRSTSPTPRSTPTRCY